MKPYHKRPICTVKVKSLKCSKCGEVKFTVVMNIITLETYIVCLSCGHMWK